MSASIRLRTGSDETVASEIGLRPNQILLLDDQAPNVEGALAMGWHAALFRAGDDLNALLPSFGLQHEA